MSTHFILTDGGVLHSFEGWMDAKRPEYQSLADASGYHACQRHVYPRRIASIGIIRIAQTAGYNPPSTPSKDANTTAKTNSPGLA